VYEAGAGNEVTIVWSEVVAVERRTSVACLGRSACASHNVETIRCASGPLTRTTPMPPRPCGVAMATMVSAVENDTGPKAQPRSEMITVFRNASPILSDASMASSATVRWTMRRA